MLCFVPNDRIDTEKILATLETFDNDKSCFLCGKNHVDIIILKKCNHIFGIKCLRDYMVKILNEDINYIENILNCPKCGSIIEKNQLEDILEKNFKEFFPECQKCKKIIFFNYHIKMSHCDHIYCLRCVEKILNGEKKCKVSSCKKNFGNTLQVNFYKLIKKCMKCKKKIGEKDLITLVCCGQIKFCKECVKYEILSQFSQLDFLNDNKKKDIICFICREKLELVEIELILNENDCDYYMKNFQNKEKCQECNKYKRLKELPLPCMHKICARCEDLHKKNCENNVRNEETTYKIQNVRIKEEKKNESESMIENSQDTKKFFSNNYYYFYYILNKLIFF